MTAYYLSKRFINAKTYTKVEIEKRVNMFFMFGQLSETEYTELMELINTQYPEAV